MISEKQPRLGEILLEKGLINKGQLTLALNNQRISGKRLGKILIDEGFVSEQDIVNLLEMQLGIHQVQLDDIDISTEVVRIIPESLARKYNCLAYKIEDGVLYVAMADPLNLVAVDDLSVATKYQVESCFAVSEDIKRLINKFYGFNEEDREEVSEEQLDEIKTKVDEAPVVKYVNNLFIHAIRLRASDIHIEPQEDDLRVRFRVDGVLQVIAPPPKNLQKLIIPRIKLMSNMNIAEKRLPQDGRMEINIDGRGIDLRVSSLPTLDGEKVVIRILDKSMFLFSIHEIGFSELNLANFNNLINHPFGMILVTGPTGCGKTSTLYTALSQLNTFEKNIITVEDPIEYRLRGVNQVQVNTRAGLTFANGLRSILRQDPNIVMVGEIRDTETADIAIRAALTGHLVLSTLHTNDAAGAITRLLDMGIEPFLVSSSVIGVVAQRLVRKICTQCQEPYVVEPDSPERRAFNVPPEEKLILYRGRGCGHCNRTGYSGRTAVHEILMVDNKIKELINEKSSRDVILKYAISNGMKTLQRDGLAKALKGITTYREVMKATYNE